MIIAAAVYFIYIGTTLICLYIVTFNAGDVRLTANVYVYFKRCSDIVSVKCPAFNADLACSSLDIINNTHRIVRIADINRSAANERTLSGCGTYSVYIHRLSAALVSAGRR